MKNPSRLHQAFSKLLFCLRVSADKKTLLRLLINSKRLDRYQRKDNTCGYEPGAPALAYSIRYLSGDHLIYLRTYAGDIRMFYEIFLERVYALPAAYLPEPLVIVDAGANIGMAALYFSIVYPRARIYCIEPDPHNFDLLQKNLASQQAEGKGAFIEAALYDRDGMVNLTNERWAYNTRISGEEGGTISEKDCGKTSREQGSHAFVQAISPDTLWDRYRLDRIDLLKIDIEGAERRLFSGGTAWLQKVHTILIEIHAQADVEPIKSRLVQNGFNWQPWDRSGTPGSGGSVFLATRAN